MKAITIPLALCLVFPLTRVRATPQDEEFQKLARDYIERELQANPENATELGDHRFDGQLTDYSPEARAKELAAQKAFRDKLDAIDGSRLTGANNIDFRILKENIDYKIFQAARVEGGGLESSGLHAEPGQ